MGFFSVGGGGGELGNSYRGPGCVGAVDGVSYKGRVGTEQE